MRHLALLVLIAFSSLARTQSARVEELLKADQWPSAKGILAAVRGYWPELILALDHPDPTVRARAAQALGAADYRLAKKPLMDRIPRETPEIAYQELCALLAIGHPRRRGKHGEPWDMDMSVDDLFSLGPKSTPLLIRFLSEEKNIGDIGYPICLALGKLGDARAIPVLIDILDRRMDWAYSGAAEALASFDDPRITPTLARNLTKEIPGFGNPAQSSLLSLGDKGFQGAALVLRESHDESVRAACAFVLRYANYKWAPALRWALNDRSPAVRDAAKDSLSEMYRRRNRL